MMFNIDSRLRGRIWVLCAFMLLIAPGCNSEEPRVTGGDYGPVTHDMLSGASLRFRTGHDKSYDDLAWTFDAENFLITAGENGLPPVLSASLLPKGVEAQEIAGKWTVTDDVITFTEITADGVATDQEPRTLETMFTGVLRIQAGPQYVFDRGQPQ